MTEEEIRQRNEERCAKLDAVSRRNMEKCAAFIARMIEKYGREVLAEIEEEERQAERVSAPTTALAIFCCKVLRKKSRSVRIWLMALTVISCSRSSFTVRLVQLFSAEIGSNRLMQRQTMDFSRTMLPLEIGASSALVVYS